MGKYKKEIADIRAQRALELYKEGKSDNFIRKELKMDSYTVKHLIESAGIKRDLNKAIRGAKSVATIYDNILNNLTPEALYWIGFLYADGHIEKNRPRISLTLSELDKEHLVKFGKFFGENIPVIQTQERGLKSNGYVCNAAYRVRFSSKEIYSRLVELGFTSRKSWDIIPHDFLKSSPHFWRGVVDGDGWVLNKDIPVVGMCGHENTVKAFLKFVAMFGIPVEATAKKEKRRDSLWKTDLRARSLVVMVLNLLYKDATVYLDRKYQKYLEIIND